MPAVDARMAPPPGLPAARLALAAVVLGGLALRSIQYFAQVDMWHDELAVARNVTDRHLIDLVSRPLDHFQVAPAGFLAMVEFSTRIIGETVAGFRFWPWLAGLASVLLFWRVADRLASGWALAAGTAVFAFSPALVWYGSSVKPYGGDVAISLLLVWLALRHLERPDNVRGAVVAGSAGGAALLLSFPAVPTAALLGMLLVASWWIRRPRTSAVALGALGAGWAVGTALSAWAALRLLDPGTDQFMRNFWGDDFPPSGNPVTAVAWFMPRFHHVFGHSLVFIPPSGPLLTFLVMFPAGLAVVGLITLAARREGRLALLLAPVLAAFGGAFAHLLPFDQRVGIHAVWPVLVLAAAALDAGERHDRRPWRVAAGVCAILLAAPLVAAVLVAFRPPYFPSDDEAAPRAVVERLAEELQDGDGLYVYTQARHDMAFYGRQAGITAWTQGERHYDDPRGYLREVDALRGHSRVWFFWVQLDRDEPGWIREYLATIGHERRRIPDGEPGEAGAVLYDLSDPTRLAAARADTFALPAFHTTATP